MLMISVLVCSGQKNGHAIVHIRKWVVKNFNVKCFKENITRSTCNYFRKQDNLGVT